MKHGAALSAMTAITLGLASAASCSGGMPAGAGGGGAGGTGGLLADARTDAQPDVESEETTDAPEEPYGEAGWTKVAWSAPCVVEVAQNPGAAAPPLIWDACAGGESGCEQVRLNWDHQDGAAILSPSVLPWGDSYRFGVLIFYQNNEHRAIVFDETGLPNVVWRSDGVGCGIFVPILTPSRVWEGAQGEKSAWIVDTYEKIGKVTKPINLHVLFQGYAASEDALGLWGASGATAIIYDRLAGTSITLGPKPDLGFYQPRPVKHSAFMRHFPEFNRAEGWVWNHATNTASVLVHPGAPTSVADIRSDGTTLVWIEGVLPFTPEGTYTSASLWTSPFATNETELVATKRWALPPMGEIISYAGNGYYGLYAPIEKEVHVYRLSDMHHWSFKPASKSFDFNNVSYVDEKYVYYQTIMDVYRQSMSALGPGDPAPAQP